MSDPVLWLMAVLSIGTVVSVWRVMLKVKRPPEFSRAEIDQLEKVYQRLGLKGDRKPE